MAEKQRIKIVGYDRSGVARVWGSHDTCEKTAYALCKEAATDYVSVRPDTGPLAAWQFMEV